MRGRPLRLLIGAALLALPASAQFQLAQARPPKALRAPASPSPKIQRQLDRLNRMSPGERKQFLAKLPPERRAQVERRLDAYSKMSPEQQEKAARQLENFRQLPPERQQALRRLSRRFEKMPEERRTLLRAEMDTLRDLDDDARRSRINSDEFRNKYSASERQILEDLSTVLAPED